MWNAKMRRLLRWFLFSITAIFLALAGAVVLAIDDQATVNRAVEFTPENVARAKRILDMNDPRKLKPGEGRRISLSEEDFDLMVNYLANRYGHGGARILLKRGAVFITTSVLLPNTTLRRFLNVDAALIATDGLPRFEHLRIGRLPVPAWLADWVLVRAVARLQEDEDYAFATNVIKNVSFADGRIGVVYEWQSDLPDKVRTDLLSRASQERLRVYQECLAEASGSLPAKNVSLTELMVPLFRLVQERSGGGDPIAENRAAIFVLTLYVNGTDMATLLPAAKDWQSPTAHHVTLNGRDDFPKHFMVSAALAAGAGGPLSDAVGLYKEVEDSRSDDSRSGSGFSFNDIAADRAGTRFGELAAASPISARNLQQQLSAAVGERALMPATDDLPEFMSEAEFKRRFGGVSAPAFNSMMAEIERRIAALPLYR